LALLAFAVGRVAWPDRATGAEVHAELTGASLSRAVGRMPASDLDLQLAHSRQQGRVNPATVLSWGDYGRGYLAPEGRRAPNPIVGLIRPIAVATGTDHVLALTAQGTVWVWGSARGHRDSPLPAYAPVPERVPGLDEVADIAAGEHHSLALKEDGTVWSWGFNGSGQLGDGSTVSRHYPRRVVGIDGIVAIGAGYSHSLALRGDGSVWAWGNGAFGSLGDGTYFSRREPVQVADLDDVVAIAAGGRHSMAVRQDGTVWSWGNGRSGVNGEQSKVTTYRPARVPDLEGVVAVAAGWNHSLALTRDGEVWAWGGNDYGQVGLHDGEEGSATPVRVAAIHGARAISAGERHSLALLDDGTVWGWGRNDYGELGEEPKIGIPSEPGPISNLTDVIAIDARGTHNVALQGASLRRLPPPQFQ
jgi:alpha-tubulin suppressor-like RCC1 family protein